MTETSRLLSNPIGKYLKEDFMKLRDLFVPKYVHSDPKVRINFINKTDDKVLLKAIMEKDQDEAVVQVARERLHTLTVSHSDSD